MKKSVLKTIAAVMLSVGLVTVVSYGCKENVGDAYDYDPVVLAPDFEVLNVDYDFDNEELNSESTITFKVSYVNNEITESVYASVLNFYVNDVITGSVVLESIESKKEYEQIFEWEAIAGVNDFRFEINLSTDGAPVVDEANTGNNTQTQEFDVPVKALQVVAEAKVAATTAAEAVADDANANIVEVLGADGDNLSTDEATETTFDDNTTMLELPVVDSTGAIDTTKSVVAIKTNAGSTNAQEQEAQTTMVVQVNVAEKEVSFYNASGKLSYKNGVLSFGALKSAKFDDCSEPGNLELVDKTPKAKEKLKLTFDETIAAEGEAAAYKKFPKILVEIMTAFKLTQGDVDNPPSYTIEILNGGECESECINNNVVKNYGFPGFKLTFKDDRNTKVKYTGNTTELAVFEKPASCTASNNGSYVFEDCGGNRVTFTFTSQLMETKTKEKCTSNVHN